MLLVMLFVLKKMSSSLPVACYVICDAAKRSNSRLKTVFKTDVFRNTYSQENGCVGAAF